MQILNICIVLMLVTSAVIEAEGIRKLLKERSSAERFENVHGTGRMSESLKKKIMMFFYGHNQKEPPKNGPTYIITIPNQSTIPTTPLSPTSSPTTSGTTSESLTFTDPTTGLTPDLTIDPNQPTQRGFPTEEEKTDVLEEDDDVDNSDETGENMAQARDSVNRLQSADSGLEHEHGINRLSELYQQQELKQANRNRLGNAQRQTNVIKTRNRRNKQQQQNRRRKQQLKKRNKRKGLNQQNKPCRPLRKKNTQNRKTNVYRVEI